MKVLLISPWGINNDQFYTAGFIHGMNNFVSLSFASNYYYGGEKPNGEIYRVFFKNTEKMPHSMKRKILRGMEYIRGWSKIIKIAQTEKFDVIHIHWLLMYKVDLRYIPVLKRYCKKMILTAHNVIPHIDGEKSVDDLRKLYSCFDTILLHGETLKAEFGHYFPELSNKLRVQYHGEYFGQSTDCCPDNDHRVKELFGERKIYEKSFIIFGNHFYNKGTDRVVRIWLKDKRFDNSQLILAGRINKNYSELMSLIPDAEKRENILLLDCFVEDDLLNFLIKKADAVVIPYRHASMSGVLHTAASFEKTVICTNTGAMGEYLEDGVDSIVCENTDDSLLQGMITANEMEKGKLAEMGKRFHESIRKNYSWGNITKKLYEEVYCFNMEEL